MKPERKKHQPKTKTKKRRDPSETTGEPQITSPSTAATEDLRESSAWAAPNETTKFSGDETGRSSMASPSRPTRRRAGRRQRVESTRVQKEIVSRPSPRPRHMDIARASDDIPVRARPSKSRDFQQRCSAEDITRRSGRGQKFPQTFGSKPAQRFRKMAPGDEAARHAPEAVRSIQADATAIGASQIYLTCGSPCHNLASPSTGSRKEADVVSPTKKLSVQSISEGGISSKDDKSGPPAGANGQSMPPCDLSLGNSYQSKIVQRTADVSVHGEEESSGGVSAGLPSKTEQAERAMPMSGASTPSGHSKQIPKSIGQSWISQVSREMAGGVTPRKGAVLALLREGMNRKTPRDVANEAPPNHHPEEPQPCRKLSAIRSASEEIYEPTSAAESRALKMTATSLSKEKKTTVKAKETRRVHIAKPASENLIDVSDVPRVTLCCDCKLDMAALSTVESLML